MRKLIAILEDESTWIEVMNSWLDDRLGMYERFVDSDPERLIGKIGSRLDDVLVLCLSRESLGGNILADFLLANPVQFPILIHSSQDSGPGEIGGRFLQQGWQVDTIGPVQGLDWIGDQWYPALKRSLHSLADAEPVTVRD